MSRKLNSTTRKQLENATKRLRIELAELMLSPIPEIDTKPKVKKLKIFFFNFSIQTEDSVFEWVSYIKGPSGSVYENGTFEFELLFPMEYPFKPPTCKVSSISRFLERTLTKHIESVCSFESQLIFILIYSIGIHSRN